MDRPLILDWTGKPVRFNFKNVVTIHLVAHLHPFVKHNWIFSLKCKLIIWSTYVYLYNWIFPLKCKLINMINVCLLVLYQNLLHIYRKCTQEMLIDSRAAWAKRINYLTRSLADLIYYFLQKGHRLKFIRIDSSLISRLWILFYNSFFKLKMWT